MSTPQQFKVGLIQMSMSAHAKDNLDRGIANIEEAAKKGANIICLPELFRSQYFCQSEDAGFFDLAEAVPGPTTEAVSAVAKKLGVAIVVPVFERRAAGIYHNSAAIIDADGSMVGFYRK
ncbi:MAG TPA: nitrilase-related carbon-nitrogen hydrolase, partial [Bacteroidota bacterium]